MVRRQQEIGLQAGGRVGGQPRLLRRFDIANEQGRAATVGHTQHALMAFDLRASS